MNPTRKLLAQWAMWLWRQQTARELGVVAAPAGDIRVLKVNKIIRSPLLTQDQRTILVYHFTRKAKADDNAEQLHMTRRVYFGRLDAALAQVEHCMALPESSPALHGSSAPFPTEGAVM